MATLSLGQTARTTAMFGAARFGSARFGYVPRETTNSAGTAASGPKNFYTAVESDAVVYTVVKR